MLLKKKKEDLKDKPYYLLYGLGSFFLDNQPTGGFELPDETKYMDSERYKLFSNKVTPNNVLILVEGFENNPTGGLIDKPEGSPFLDDETYQIIKMGEGEEIHGVLVDKNNTEQVTIDSTQFIEIGDCSHISIGDVYILNWHGNSDGITYKEFAQLLDKIIDDGAWNLFMGDSNITVNKVKKLVKEDSSLIDHTLIKKAEEQQVSLIKVFIEEYKKSNPSVTIDFKVPEFKIAKKRYLGNIILNNQLHKASDIDFDGMFIIDFGKDIVRQDRRTQAEQNTWLKAAQAVVRGPLTIPSVFTKGEGGAIKYKKKHSKQQDRRQSKKKEKKKQAKRKSRKQKKRKSKNRRN